MFEKYAEMLYLSLIWNKEELDIYTERDIYIYKYIDMSYFRQNAFEQVCYTYLFFEAKGNGTSNLSVIWGRGEWNKYAMI